MSRATILMYHAIDHPQSDAEASLCCPPARLRSHLACLREAGCTFVSLDRALAIARGAPAEAHAVSVTIDDGFTCAHANALPVFAEFGVPATVFVVAGLIGGPATWLAGARLPMRTLMSAPQLRELAARGVAVGSHGYLHARLDECPDRMLQSELHDSRHRLEDVLGASVTAFAYPYGRHDRRVRDAVAGAGYTLACTTEPERVSAAADPLRLPRVTVDGHESAWQMRGKVRFGTNDMPPLSLVRRPLKRLLAAGWSART